MSSPFLTGTRVRHILLHAVAVAATAYLMFLVVYAWSPFHLSSPAQAVDQTIRNSNQLPVGATQEQPATSTSTPSADASLPKTGGSQTLEPSRVFVTGSTAKLVPDADGVLMDNLGDRFSSPNGAYTLTLKTTGDVVLTRNDALNGSGQPVWWTSTGDHRKQTRTYRLAFSSGEAGDADGIGGSRKRLAVHRGPPNGNWQTVWHSDLEPACSANTQLASSPGDALLTLDDSGALRIPGQCDLYTPPVVAETNRSLALIVTGLYRTLESTCPTHVGKLLRHGAFSRVDVFAHILYTEHDLELLEKSDPQHAKGTPELEALEKVVRDCYGPNLKALDLVRDTEAEEPFPADVDFIQASSCGARLHRLNNQLKTLHKAGRLWWTWSVQNAFQHDTVMRIRPDTFFIGDMAEADTGDLMPELNIWSLEELGTNTLVMPHPNQEHYFYCPRASGGMQVGTTDQIAYGHPSAMWSYLNMYQDFPAVVELGSPGQGHSAARDFSGCELLPSGPTEADCKKLARCSIECIVPWYLDSRGVRFIPEWDWRQQLKREDGLKRHL